MEESEARQRSWKAFLRLRFGRKYYWTLIAVFLWPVAYFLPRCLTETKHNPPVGVYTIIFGVVAAAVTLRKDPSPYEKAAWIFLMTLIGVAEIKNMYVADEKQTAIFQGIQGGLGHTLSGLQAAADDLRSISGQIKQASQDSQDQFETTMAESTGADSLCLMLFERGSLGWKNLGVPEFYQKGKFPLHGVGAEITDSVKLKKMMSSLSPGQGLILAAARSAQIDYFVGDLPTGAHKTLWGTGIDVGDHKDIAWTINYAATNGSWTEDFRASFVGGQWTQALRVYRKSDAKGRPIKPFLFVDPAYPRNTSGEVDWSVP